MTMTETYTCAKGGRCEGDGWVRVGDAYIDGIAPWPDKPAEETEEALAAYEIAVETTRIRRESARNTVYPCKACRPEAFSRWAGRHWTPDHDRAACDECVSTGSSTSSNRPAALNERDRVPNEPDPEQPPTTVYEERMMDL